MTYIKQLDSIRGIAVILVILSHWLPYQSAIKLLQTGVIGVTVFFVLSGFLITRILFEQKADAALLGIKEFAVIKNFYVRRALRIFPIYYLLILVVLLFAKYTNTDIKSSFVYYATYTINFKFFDSQASDGMLSHLWTLAVEEQFYLVWPWLILFATRNRSLQIILLFILTGVISQYLLAGNKWSTALTFTCFDALGLGALLAWVTTYVKDRTKKYFRILSVVAGFALLLFVLGVVRQEWDILPQRTLISVLSAWLILFVVVNKERKKRLSILNSGILIFLGKISYGMYLYHNLIPGTLYSQIINKYLNPLLPEFLYKQYWRPIAFLECFVVLLVISWLSYVLIERRFLNLKKYFRLPGNSLVPTKQDEKVSVLDQRGQS